MILLRTILLGMGPLLWSTSEAAREDWPDLVLDQRILTISSIAADLSALAYADETTISQWLVGINETSNVAEYDHPDYDEIQFYTEEPDQAIVAKKDGRCYLAFRGTNVNFDDWSQNINLGNELIYKDNIDTGNDADRCEARQGFADFLTSTPVVRGRADLQDCLDSCENPDDCLVITGHSQGGATSTIAAITLFSNNPIVVTFGQPPAVDGDCPFIDDSRFFRFVNWVQDAGQDDDIGFDLVVYSPNWISGSQHYGYNILVGEDPTSVYYGGYRHDIEFLPNRVDNKISAHTMAGTDFSYQSRISALVSSLPDIRSDGAVGGTICKGFYPQLCASNSCVENLCVPVGGVVDTCIQGSCENDEDCAGNLVCLWDACATRDGEVEPGCPCRDDSQCFNQECITNSIFSLDFICDPDKPNIPKVNETCIPESCSGDVDCKGDLVCIYGACATASGEVRDGCPCLQDQQCESNNCITVNVVELDFVCDSGAAVWSLLFNLAVMLGVLICQLG